MREKGKTRTEEEERDESENKRVREGEEDKEKEEFGEKEKRNNRPKSKAFPKFKCVAWKCTSSALYNHSTHLLGRTPLVLSHFHEEDRHLEEKELAAALLHCDDPFLLDLSEPWKNFWVSEAWKKKIKKW